MQSAETAQNQPSRSLNLHLLMIASGFAGLGYEMVWTQMLAMALGHEAVSVLAVLVAFFAGLAFGAWVLDNKVRQSAHPERIYAALELVIGIWALLMIGLVPIFNQIVFNVLGQAPHPFAHWLVAFGGTFVLLLPATAAMGATLPAMERVLSLRTHNGFAVGGLYAANTVGAMLGTVAGTFILARFFGFTVTLIILAAINFVCAGVMFFSSRKLRPSVAAASHQTRRALSGHRLRLALLLFVTGFLGLGYEVVAIRVLAQVLENTVFTFASLLAVYLSGSAIGAALYQRLANKESFETMFRKIVLGLALTSLAGVVMLSFARPAHLVLVGLLGDGMVAGIAGEWVIAMLVFLPPTLFMGASFAHLAQAARTNLGVGGAVAINTLGAALAPIAFGVLILPAVGARLSLLIIAAAYAFILPTKRETKLAGHTGIITAVIVVLLLPFNLRIVDVPEGGALLAFEEGRMANVAVVSDTAGTRFLKVNNQYTMGSTNSRFSDRRQAHIPLLLHSDPRRALFLGIGTGSTFVAASEHPDLNATAVELLPELMSTLDYFGSFEAALARHPNLNIVVADARRFVVSTQENYDVVIADVFHPARDGAAALYTLEHFAAIRERLAVDGLFCQWLPLFQLDLPTLKSIVRSFTAVFPSAELHLAHFSLGQPIVGLVGRRNAHRYEADYMTNRRSSEALRADLETVRLTDDFALFGGFLAGGDELQAFAASAPLNTDDHPVVAWSAPRFLFAAPEPAYVRLFALVSALEPNVHKLIDTSQDSVGAQDYAVRLRDYWQARNAYLEIGVDVVLTNDTRKMLEQIGLPLMQVVETSEDFSPAYMPLLHMGIELSSTEPVVGRALLKRLEMAAPNRPEAARARQQLFSQ